MRIVPNVLQITICLTINVSLYPQDVKNLTLWELALNVKPVMFPLCKVQNQFAYSRFKIVYFTIVKVDVQNVLKTTFYKAIHATFSCLDVNN